MYPSNIHRTLLLSITQKKKKKSPEKKFFFQEFCLTKKCFFRSACDVLMPMAKEILRFRPFPSMPQKNENYFFLRFFIKKSNPAAQKKKKLFYFCFFIFCAAPKPAKKCTGERRNRRHRVGLAPSYSKTCILAPFGSCWGSRRPNLCRALKLLLFFVAEMKKESCFRGVPSY